MLTSPFFLLFFFSAQVHLIDGEGQPIQTLEPSDNRISSFAWSGSVLTLGGRDHVVSFYDTRARPRAGSYFSSGGAHRANVATLEIPDGASWSLQDVAGRTTSLPRSGSGEVCGLAWSEGSKQLAVGAANNRCMVWDAANLSRPRYVYPLFLCLPLFKLFKIDFLQYQHLTTTPLHATHTLYTTGCVLPSQTQPSRPLPGLPTTQSCFSRVAVPPTAACAPTTPRLAPSWRHTTLETRCRACTGRGLTWSSPQLTDSAPTQSTSGSSRHSKPQPRWWGTVSASLPQHSPPMAPRSARRARTNRFGSGKSGSRPPPRARQRLRSLPRRPGPGRRREAGAGALRG